PCPAIAAERGGDGCQLEARLEPRAVEALLAQLAVLEMFLAEPHAADVQALEVLRLVAFADDQLRATAADIDDQVSTVLRIDVMRNTEIDEACLFHSRDDFDGVPERLLGPRQKRVGV